MEPETFEVNVDRDEFFVEAVRSHRCLWDTGSKLHRDRVKKEQAWVAVSSALKAKWSESVSSRTKYQHPVSEAFARANKLLHATYVREKNTGRSRACR